MGGPGEAHGVDEAADAGLLARLADAVGCASGALRWHFIGSPRGPCRVWQVSGPRGQGGVVVKQFRGERAFAQERRAYERWLPQLPEETASLISVHPAPVRALVLRRVPGEPLARAQVTPALERAAHKRAGYFLRALHAIDEPDGDPLPLGEAVQRRCAAWLARVQPALGPGEFAQLRARVAPADDPGLFAGARRVPCHRDFTPGNWLVSGPGDDGELAGLDGFFVIDFEHAHLDCPLLDLVKLWTDVWPGRPGLESAFFAGYGRHLGGAELARLGVLAAMHAMATIAWAHEHADLQFHALGQRALRRVLA